MLAVATLKQHLPPTMRPGGFFTSRMTDMEVTLLPQPLSPTMPSVDLRPNDKLTPSTALTIPRLHKSRCADLEYLKY
ncbi:MAG: hypothetical protein R2911_03875 [Caldilineaceae bacterium]